MSWTCGYVIPSITCLTCRLLVRDFLSLPTGGGGGRFLCHQSQAVVPVGERGDEWWCGVSCRAKRCSPFCSVKLGHGHICQLCASVLIYAPEHPSHTGCDWFRSKTWGVNEARLSVWFWCVCVCPRLNTSRRLGTLVSGWSQYLAACEACANSLSPESRWQIIVRRPTTQNHVIVSQLFRKNAFAINIPSRRRVNHHSLQRVLSAWFLPIGGFHGPQEVSQLTWVLQ